MNYLSCKVLVQVLTRVPETVFFGRSVSYLCLYVLPEVVGAHRKGNPLPFTANTPTLYVNWISRLLLTFVKPKGRGQIKPSSFTEASLLSYNARSCRSKIMLAFVSLSAVIQFRKTLLLIFIVWLNWFDTA